MKKIILIFGLFFAVTIIAAPVDDLKKQLNELNTMRANFSQKTLTDNSDYFDSASGNMALSKPGKFRWETQKPNEQLILADGKWIWIYDKDLEQATKQLQETTNSNNPALFLSGDVSDLGTRFKVSFEKDHFILSASSEEDMFQSMELYFENDAIKKMIVKTRLGQTSVFTFSNIEKNIMLPTDLFGFVPPKGTDIIEN